MTRPLLPIRKRRLEGTEEGGAGIMYARSIDAPLPESNPRAQRGQIPCVTMLVGYSDTWLLVRLEILYPD